MARRAHPFPPRRARAARAVLAAAAPVVLAAGALGVPARPAGAAPDPESAAGAAVAYLASTQYPSGGFDAPDGYAGFRTVDVALALAQEGQTGAAWSTAEALAAVQAVASGGNDALDYLDDEADGALGTALSAGKAAQLVVVAAALGLDPAAFDPQGDGPTDLVATMEAGAPSYGSVYTAPYGALAHAALGHAVPGAVHDYLLAEQAANGSFGPDSVDTTGLAVAALVAAGEPATGDAVRGALGYLASQHDDSGGFLNFGATSANSTALAMVGITAAGYDPEEPCWRDEAVPDAAGSPYAAPGAYLLGLQGGDGRITDPADYDPAFATAQAVQGLLRRFVPPVRAAARPCDAAATTTTTAPAATTTTAPAATTTTTAAPATTTSTVPVGGQASSTTSAPASSTGPTTSVAGASGELPRTGAGGGALALGGLALAAGAALALAARRARAATP